MVRLVLLRLLESYFRHRWLYLLPVVLMATLFGVYVYYAPPIYTASGSLYVQKQTLLTTLVPLGETRTWRTPAQLTEAEINELVKTDAFVRSVIRQTPLERAMSRGPIVQQETIQYFRESIWTQSLGDNLVRVGSRSSDPQTAQTLVSALLNAYMQWKLNADRQESVVAQEFFANVIPTYQAEQKRARDALDAFLKVYPDPVRGERPTEELIQLQTLQAAVSQANERAKNALDKEESARLALSKAESDARQNYVVIDAPVLPQQPEGSLRTMVMYGAIFLGAGLLLMLVGVVGGAVLDRTLRLPIDVNYQVGLPVVASLPTASSDRALALLLRRDTPEPPEEQSEAEQPQAIEPMNVPSEVAV